MSAQPPLTEPFEIGGVPISNRVLLAPLAGIGNWFVRLQARRTIFATGSTDQNLPFRDNDRPGILSMAGGLPSPDSFPVEAMRVAYAAISARPICEQARIIWWLTARLAADRKKIDVVRLL